MTIRYFHQPYMHGLSIEAPPTISVPRPFKDVNQDAKAPEAPAAGNLYERHTDGFISHDYTLSVGQAPEAPAAWSPTPGNLVKVVGHVKGITGEKAAPVGAVIEVGAVEKSAQAGAHIIYERLPDGFVASRGYTLIVEPARLSMGQVPAASAPTPTPDPTKARKATDTSWSFRDSPVNVDLPRVLREANDAGLSYFVLTIAPTTKDDKAYQPKRYLFVRNGSTDVAALRAAEPGCLASVHRMLIETNPSVTKASLTFLPPPPVGSSVPDWLYFSSYIYTIDTAVAKIKAARANRGKVRITVEGER